MEINVDLPSLIKALRYSRPLRILISGMALGSGMAASISFWSLRRMSWRRVSSQRKYDSEMEVVSEPATLERR